MKFQPLYKRHVASDDKWLVWCIRVEDNDIVRTFGQEHGHLQTVTKTITKGKNIGKVNETTPHEQACKEAQSLWKNQQTRHGYNTDKTNHIRCQPMLAQSFNLSKIKFPCFVQPKLDGVRLWLTYDRAYSRSGKEFTTQVKHLLQSVPENMILDGELYKHGIPFDTISGCLRNVANNDNGELMEFHVYDIVDTSQPYEYRLRNLRNTMFNNTYIKTVKTHRADCIDTIMKYHEAFALQGYEGLMVRNKSSVYEYKRSYHLQKLKTFTDSEFKIIGAKEALGEDRGTAILQCETSDKTPFWVRPVGPRELRTRMLSNIDELLGKYLTVKYQNLTENGVPRFPVGLRIREDYDM